MGVRRLWLCVLLAAAGALGADPAGAGAGAGAGEAAPRPNIVVLFVDDMGFGDLGAFGNTTARTPFVNRLSLAGLRMTQFISAAPICTPSRAALLTGRYPVRSGMTSNHPNFRTLNSPAQPSGLPASEVTIARVLKDAGYRTACVGKWHLGTPAAHLPTAHGFDSFFGMPVTNVQSCGKKPIYAHETKFAFFMDRAGLPIAIAAVTAALLAASGRLPGPLHALARLAFAAGALAFVGAYYYMWTYTLLTPRSCVLMRGEEVIEQPVRLPGLTQRLVAEAEGFIDESVRAEQPFFLYFPFVKLHTALFTAPEFEGRSGHGAFVDNVEELDWAVSRVMRALAQHKIVNRTLVVLTSDNGPFLERGHEAGTTGAFPDSIGTMQRLRGAKGQNWEGGIRVPAIFTWPGHIPPKSSTNQVVSSMDLFPTFARLAGAPLPSDRHIDGRDLSPLLFDPITLSRTHAKTETAVHDVLFHYCGGRVSAMRRGHYKLHFFTPKYDIRHETDPALAADKAAKAEADGLAWKHGCRECCPLGVICPCEGAVHDPPLLFDLHEDPSESTPIAPTKKRYKKMVRQLLAAKAEHEATLDKEPPKPTQLHVFPRPWLQPCCGEGCRCCKECSADEDAAHKAEWDAFFGDFLYRQTY